MKIKPEMEDQMQTEYASGATLQQIADAHNVSHVAVYRLLVKKGVSLRNRGRSASPVLSDRDQKIQELYVSERYSLQQIADHFKISRQRVYQIISEQKGSKDAKKSQNG